MHHNAPKFKIGRETNVREVSVCASTSIMKANIVLGGKIISTFCSEGEGKGVQR